MDEDDSELLKPEHARKFRSIAKQMNKLIAEIRQYVPDANMYLEDSGNWHLMSGDSHEYGGNNKMRQDRIMACEHVWHSGGGAW